MPNDEENIQAQSPDGNDKEKVHTLLPVSGMYENWFLEYASYVILERAVPAIEDGLKPVQRRIMHSMKDMDDGRYNKVANIIGHAMQYHPHGDAAIGEAIVNLGQKDLLIDTQGNWGDIRTGDSAAASRYIEARLSKFANSVVFNPQTTVWQSSYDGRKKEPTTLPVKFPLLLAQGVEGIAVGLATKIMPHNFCELIHASIDQLKGKKTAVFPDFPTGGFVDVSNYNDGLKGGRLRVRARIEELDKKSLIIKDIPFTTTTGSLIDSILKANDNGKIKIKKVTDNTAKDVEILVQLAPGVSPDVAIDALYAFTDCEVSIAPNACVIINDKPHFIGASEILKTCTENTVKLLNLELEIRKAELMEKLLFSSLEKLFIQDEMYIEFKNYSEKKTLFVYLDNRFEKYKPQFFREIGDEDFDKLTQIPMIRITRFDTAKADEKMRGLEEELAQVNHHLAHLVDYAIDYYKDLLTKYGKGRERKTEIRAFDTIDASIVAAANVKLYVNREEGFVGSGLKKDEFVCECSDIDDIIVFKRNGSMMVTKVADKTFVGKDIIHIGVFQKNDERMVYNMAYLDGTNGATMVKRFQVLGVTRDKDYILVKENPKSKVLYFTANPNGEAEVVTIMLTSGSTAKKKVFDFNFAELAIKGRSSGGNRLTKYPVRKMQLKHQGVSTLNGLNIWYDENIGRLNKDERGTFLGQFEGEDNILVIYKDGSYELTNFELTNRYEPNDVVLIEKYNPNKVISVVYFEGDAKTHYVKRFNIETTTINKKFVFLPETKGTNVLVASTSKDPSISITIQKGKEKAVEKYSLLALVEVKGWKALGNKLSNDKVLSVVLEEPEEEDVEEETQVNDEETTKETDKSTNTDKKLNIGDSLNLDVKPKDNKDKDSNDQLNLF